MDEGGGVCGNGAAGKGDVLLHKLVNGIAQLILRLGFRCGRVNTVYLVLHGPVETQESTWRVMILIILKVFPSTFITPIVDLRQ